MLGPRGQELIATELIARCRSKGAGRRGYARVGENRNLHRFTFNLPAEAVRASRPIRLIPPTEIYFKGVWGYSALWMGAILSR
jgi:hypothetical protein